MKNLERHAIELQIRWRKQKVRELNDQIASREREKVNLEAHIKTWEVILETFDRNSKPQV